MLLLPKEALAFIAEDKEEEDNGLANDDPNTVVTLLDERRSASFLESPSVSSSYLSFSGSDLFRWYSCPFEPSRGSFLPVLLFLPLATDAGSNA